MPAVAYVERFGAGETRLYRQVRATRVPVVTHEHVEAEAYPHDRVEVVPLRHGLIGGLVTPVRRQRFLLPLATVSQVVDRILESGADAIHAYHGVAAARMRRIASRLRCRLLATLFGVDVLRLPEQDPAFDAALRDTLERADRILVSSETSRNRLLAMGCDGERVEILPMGVALPALRPRRARNRDTIRVAHVGRYRPSEGVPALVDAVSLARRMGAPIELHLAGDGPERAVVERHVERAALRDVVHIHGAMNESRQGSLLDRSDLFVLNRLPSEGAEAEEIPVPLLQAMARGLCVVAARHGIIPEAVKDGVTGLLLDGQDTNALAGTLVTIARDPGLRIALGGAARARIERDYDAGRAVQRLRQLYG